MGRKLAVDPQLALKLYKEMGATRRVAKFLSSKGKRITGVMVWRALQKTAEGRDMLRHRAKNKRQSRRRKERIGV